MAAQHSTEGSMGRQGSFKTGRTYRGEQVIYWQFRTATEIAFADPSRHIAGVITIDEQPDDLFVEMYGPLCTREARDIEDEVLGYYDACNYRLDSGAMALAEGK